MTKSKKPPVLNLGKLPSQFLQQLIGKLPRTGAEVIVPPGIGRDAAGIKIGRRFFAVTTDPITLATNRIATYSIYVNMNDVACLGCVPRWYTGTLLLPPQTTEKVVRDIWHELANVLRRNHIQSIGGHVEVTSAVNRPVLVGQMIGEALHGKLLNPAKIKPGDCLLLWQKLAIEGTAIIAQEKKEKLKKYFSASAIQKMKRLLNHPGISVFPFVKKLLACTREVIALHDPTEGGIATAIHELADAANCGVAVDYDKLLFLPETLRLAKIFKFDPLGILASGSVLIVCRPQIVHKILRFFPHEPLTIIGAFTTTSCGRALLKNGKTLRLPRFDQDEITAVI